MKILTKVSNALRRGLSLVIHTFVIVVGGICLAACVSLSALARWIAD